MLRCQRVVFYISAAGDPAHGVVEGQAEDLDEEVDGVAGEVALRPTPIRVFDQEALVMGQYEVPGGQLDELEAALLEQRGQRSYAGGSDLLTRPAAGATGEVGHSHFASGVG